MDQITLDLQSQTLQQQQQQQIRPPERVNPVPAPIATMPTAAGTDKPSNHSSVAAVAVVGQSDDDADDSEKQQNSEDEEMAQLSSTSSQFSGSGGEKPTYGNPESEILAILADKRRGHHRKDRPAKKWTKEEDELLFNAVSEFGARSWKTVATKVPGRDHTQCLQRWTKCLQPGLRKGTWTPEEDEALIKCVTLQIALIQRNSVTPQDPQLSAKRVTWADVCQHIQGRTAKQCRERWVNNLDPVILKGPWSQAEDDKMVELYKKYGPSWAAIAKEIPGRTENAVKIRWKTVMKTPAGKDAITNSPYITKAAAAAAAVAAVGSPAMFGESGDAPRKSEKKHRSSASSSRPSKQQRRSPKFSAMQINGAGRPPPSVAGAMRMDPQHEFATQQQRMQQQQHQMMYNPPSMYQHFVPPQHMQQQQQQSMMMQQQQQQQQMLQQPQWMAQQNANPGSMYDPNNGFGRFPPSYGQFAPPPQGQQQQSPPYPSAFQGAPFPGQQQQQQQPFHYMQQPPPPLLSPANASNAAAVAYANANAMSFHYQMAQQQQQMQDANGLHLPHNNALHNVTAASQSSSARKASSSGGSSSGSSFHSLLNASLNSSHNYRSSNAPAPASPVMFHHHHHHAGASRSSDEESVSSAASGALVEVNNNNNNRAPAGPTPANGRKRSGSNNSVASGESFFSLRAGSVGGSGIADLNDFRNTNSPSSFMMGGGYVSNAPGGLPQPFYGSYAPPHYHGPPPPPQQNLLFDRAPPMGSSSNMLPQPQPFHFQQPPPLPPQQQHNQQAAFALASLASAASGLPLPASSSYKKM